MPAEIYIQPGFWMSSFMNTSSTSLIACPLGDVSCIGGAFNIADLLVSPNEGSGATSGGFTSLDKQMKRQGGGLLDFQCGKSFEGLVCNECPRGHYLNWLTFDCSECRGSEYIRDLILLLPIGLFVPILFTYFLFPDLSMFSRFAIMKHKLSQIGCVADFCSIFSRGKLFLIAACNSSHNEEALVKEDDEEEKEDINEIENGWGIESSSINSINNSNNARSQSGSPIAKSAAYRVDNGDILVNYRNKVIESSTSNSNKNRLGLGLDSFSNSGEEKASRIKTILLHFQINTSFFRSLTTLNIMLYMIQLCTCLGWLFQADLNMQDIGIGISGSDNGDGGDLSFLSLVTESLGRVAHTVVFRLSFLSSCISADWSTISIFQLAATCQLAIFAAMYLQYQSWVARISHCHSLGISLDSTSSGIISNCNDHRNGDIRDLEFSIALMVQKLRTYYFTLFLFFYLLWLPGLVQLGVDSIACIDIGPVFDSYLVHSSTSATVTRTSSSGGIDNNSSQNLVIDGNFTVTTTDIGSVSKSDIAISCSSRVFEWNYIFFWSYIPTILLLLLLIILYLNSSTRKAEMQNRQSCLQPPLSDTVGRSTLDPPRIFECCNSSQLQVDTFSQVAPLQSFFHAFKPSYWYWTAIDLVKRTAIFGSGIVEYRLARYLGVMAVLSVSIAATVGLKPYKVNSNNVLSVISDSVVLAMVAYLFTIDKLLHNSMNDVSKQAADINKMVLHLIPLLAMLGMVGHLLCQLYHFKLEHSELQASLKLRIILHEAPNNNRDGSESGWRTNNNDLEESRGFNVDRVERLDLNHCIDIDDDYVDDDYVDDGGGRQRRGERGGGIERRIDRRNRLNCINRYNHCDNSEFDDNDELLEGLGVEIFDNVSVSCDSDSDRYSDGAMDGGEDFKSTSGNVNSPHSSFYSFRSCAGSEYNDYSDDNDSDSVDSGGAGRGRGGGGDGGTRGVRGTIIRRVTVIERLPT